MEVTFPAVSIPHPLYKDGDSLYFVKPLFARTNPIIPQTHPTKKHPKTSDAIPKTNATTEFGAVVFVVNLFSSICIFFEFVLPKPLRRYVF